MSKYALLFILIFNVSYGQAKKRVTSTQTTVPTKAATSAPVAKTSNLSIEDIFAKGVNFGEGAQARPTAQSGPTYTVQELYRLADHHTQRLAKLELRSKHPVIVNSLAISLEKDGTIISRVSFKNGSIFELRQYKFTFNDIIVDDTTFFRDALAREISDLETKEAKKVGDVKKTYSQQKEELYEIYR